AEDADPGVGGDQGITLAGHGLDQGRFAASVGSEDGDVFSAADREVDVVEDGVVAAGDGDVFEGEEGLGRGGARIFGHSASVFPVVFSSDCAMRGRVVVCSLTSSGWGMRLGPSTAILGRG